MSGTIAIALQHSQVFISFLTSSELAGGLVSLENVGFYINFYLDFSNGSFYNPQVAPFSLYFCR